jgi:hypothetical protein
MTLLATLAARDFVIQVADTLLSSGGMPVAEDLTKTVACSCKHGRLTVSYTGLAILDGHRTDRWIARRLFDFEVWSKSANDVLLNLTNALTAAIPSNPLLTNSSYGLTLAIGGVGRLPNGKPSTLYVEISNTQRWIPYAKSFRVYSPPDSQFHCSPFYFGPTLPYGIWLLGAWGDKFEANSIRRKLVKLLESAATQQDRIAIARLATTMIRQHTARHNLSGVIGDDCTVTTIDSTIGTTFMFYSRRPTSGSRTPIIVRPGTILEDYVLPWPNQYGQLVNIPI